MSERKVNRAHSGLSEQIEAVVSAMQIAEPYLEPEVVDHAAVVIERAEARRQLSADHVVFGLFGATGSGKSSLFNALVGSDIAQTGVIRPTTTKTVAAIWQPQGAGELLDWLEVSERHVLDSQVLGAEAKKSQDPAGGLILLDLPDMDSTSTEHHQIASRLAGQVDYLVWVLDPQKYADASIHHGYLSELSGQRGNLLVVLNQIDTIASSDRAPVSGSLAALLESEGVGQVPVILASARTGEGLEDIRGKFSSALKTKVQATRRLRADVDELLRTLEGELAVPKVRMPGVMEQSDLERNIAKAHGTHRIAEAVQTSYKLRASTNTGWPITSWLTRLRNDPLKRMNLGRGIEKPEISLTSRPDLSVAENAAVDQSVGRYLGEATEDLSPRWSQSLKDGVHEQKEQLANDIDIAIASSTLGVEKKSWWWPVTKFVQWLGVIVALAGALWLGGIALAAYFQFDLPQTPRVEGIAIPTLMVFTGILLGIVLGILGSFVNRMVARLKRRKALKNLQNSVSGVVRRYIVDPTAHHLEQYNSYAALISNAAKKAE
ncbi:GTPase [Glutamicibacter sp. AOP38-B1-38]|uniref:GTPase n=1 Tax=Glutamicibacter sp. AOP38-B1-38 TaxID=3457680 RepID=UPI004034C1DB